jgi:Flp pilus assembly protein TadD
LKNNLFLAAIVSLFLAQPGSSIASDSTTTSPDKLAHARSLIDQKKFEAAHEELDGLLKERPDDPSVAFWLAKASMYLDRRAEGEAYFERYHRLALGKKGYKPGDMLLVLARLCRERGDIAASRKWLDQVDPDETDAYFSAQIQRYMLLAMERDWTGALALADSLDPRTPEDLVQVILTKADALRQLGRLEEAFDVLVEGTSRVKADPELLNLYASVARQLGCLEIAESASRLGIEIAPGNAKAYNNLAYSFAERNIRLQYASQLAAKALEISPNDPYVLDTMGYVQYRLGNLGVAEATLRRSRALIGRPEVTLHLVEVLLQKGEREEARTLFSEAQTKIATDAPADDPLHDKIKRLQLRF